MLRNKLYLGLLPLLALLILVGVAGILVCGDLARSSREKINRSYAVMMGDHELRDAAGGMVIAMHAALRGRVFEAREDYEEERGRFKRELMTRSFEAAGTGREEAVRLVADAFERMERAGDAVMQTGERGAQVGYNDVETVYYALLFSLDELLRTDSHVMQVEAYRVAGIARVSMGVLAGVILAGIVLSVLLAFALARMLLGPIGALTASARALGEGNLNDDVPVRSNDELGVLAQTFNTMAARLREYRDAMTARVVRAQRTMEATLTSTPDPLFVVSQNGGPAIRNPAAEKLAALPEFADGFPEPLGARVQEVLRTQEHFLPTGYEHVIPVAVDHDERYYMPRILSISDKLTGQGSAAILLQDVTKFRLLDHAKNNLVGTVSHELKTPLTSLRMAVYLLLEQNTGALTPAQRDLLETARDDADRLLRILNDILDLARIESGTAAISRRDTAIRPLLEEMAREMRPIITGAGQRINIRVAPDAGVDGNVFLDAERIRHVFINLLGNASKYTPEGGVIELYAGPDAGGPGAVRFGVRDTGAGIAEADVPHVFQKFYRAPGQTRKGAGLGLSIAREIVTAHGGVIACTSKPGEGSDFHFVIPARQG
jgi:signal transduction histidine kinase